MIFSFFYLLISSLIITIFGQFQGREHFDFDVVLAEKGPLGLQLSDNLEVQSLNKQKYGDPSVLEDKGILINDKLVAVNGNSVENEHARNIIYIVKEATWPLTLTFRPYDGQHREVINMFGPEAPMHVDEAMKTGHIDIMDGPHNLVSVPAIKAAFGHISHCSTVPIVVPSRKDGCFYLEDSGNYKDKIILVSRGYCTFAEKAIAAFKEQVAGIIVENSENGAFEMSAPEGFFDYNHKNSVPAAVMVSLHHGEQIRNELKNHEYKGLTARMVITETCIRGDATFHNVQHMLDKRSQYTREEIIAVVEDDFIVTAKGKRIDLKNEKSIKQNQEDIRVYLEEHQNMAKRHVTGNVKNEIDTYRNDMIKKSQERRISDNIKSGEIQIFDEEGELKRDQITEFLASTFGGYIPNSEVLVKYVQSTQTCDEFNQNIKIHDGILISITDPCGIARVIELATKIGISIVIFINDDFDSFAKTGPLYRIKSNAFGNKESIIEQETFSGIATIGVHAGKRLHKLIEEATDGALIVKFSSKPEIARYWEDLDKLRMPKNWPTGAKRINAIYAKLKKLHDPKSRTGSIDRYEYFMNIFHEMRASRGEL